MLAVAGKGIIDLLKVPTWLLGLLLRSGGLGARLDTMAADVRTHRHQFGTAEGRVATAHRCISPP